MGAPHLSVAERWWNKVSPEPNSGCWLWTGSLDGHGYGQLNVHGKLRTATHIALEIDGRPRTPEAPCALHKCDNPICVNPDHLEWGTMKQNTQQSIERGRANSTGLALGHRSTRRVVECCQCGRAHERTPGYLATRVRVFCSAACSVQWQRENYTGRRKGSWRRGADEGEAFLRAQGFPWLEGQRDAA